MSRRQKGLLLTLAMAASGISGACSPDPEEMGDAEKQARIAELYQQSKSSAYPEIPDVEAEELRELRKTEEVVVVDVRGANEREVSMIAGAIPQDDFEARLEADPEVFDGRKVVFYCTLGHRSGLYTAKLRERGLDAYNLKGSILAWTHAGGELVDAETGETTKRVHVYGKNWDLAAGDYDSTW